MTSHSQAGQDLFVSHLLNYKRDGHFLEIGCCEPINLSNTFSLEQDLGWRGLMVDIDQNAVDLCKSRRSSHTNMVCFDTTSEAFARYLRAYYPEPEVLDYLSLDVDSASLASLERIPTDLRFRVITCEHDLYRFGEGPRNAMRRILTDQGYLCLCSDVRATTGEPYEDWWIDPKQVDMERALPFTSDNLTWPEILKKGGVML